MSDGALSQEEIDSLLAGLDTGGGGGKTAAAPGSSGGGNVSREAQFFKSILEGTAGSQSQNLSMITGLDVTVGAPQVDQVQRDAVLQSVPEEVLAVQIDMTGGIPGEHLFILSKETAVRIASLANKDDSLTDLDDMAISAVSECVSTLTGTLITVFTDRTGNRSLQSSSAEGNYVPKAMVRLPSGDFIRVVWPVNIGGKPEQFVETFSLSFVRDVVAAAGGGGAPAQPAMQAPAMGGMGGMNAQAMGMYSQPMGGMFAGMANSMGGMSPPNVQPVQFANLAMQSAPPEAGNIGLIMDVFMEMTVELGRTRKLIKEILGMGEGTIIELDKLAGEPVDILVNHKLIAKGEVVVIDENFGVRVTEIVSPMERMSDMS
ncbi:MAG TPA: flagellar motor switch protein FliN [Spirochaetia bacterium]|nr:flagellar motor switch protein FliN [Spirochaetales bacterium]HRY80260.1 flagellar motor switch protein FliN [Spirochaetia bacterium]